MKFLDFRLALIFFLFFWTTASYAAPAAPITVDSMATLSGLTSQVMAANPQIILRGYYSGAAAGGGSFSYIASGAGTPDIGSIIAPSNHSGTCSFGCMVRQLNGGPLTPQMFGAKGDDSTDDLTAFRALASAASLSTGLSHSVYIPLSQFCYLISAAVSFTSALHIYGDAGPYSCIHETNLDDSIFTLGAGSSGTVVENLKFKYSTGTGSNPYVGGLTIAAPNSNITVRNVEFDHMIRHGVFAAAFWLTPAQYITNVLVDKVYVHDTQGTATSGGDDVSFLGNVQYSIVQNSRLLGGANAATGVTFQDPYCVSSGYDACYSIHNKALYNEIGPHSTYGVLLGYQTTDIYDADNQAIGNIIWGITGTGNGTGGAGMCIYTANGGGYVIANNTVNDCTQTTSNFTNAPAAITITASDSSRAPSFVQGNRVLTAHLGAAWFTGATVLVSGNSFETTATTSCPTVRITDIGPNSELTTNRIVSNTGCSSPSLDIFTTIYAINGLKLSANTVQGDTEGLSIVGTNALPIDGVVSGNGFKTATGGTAALFNYWSGPLSGNRMTAGGTTGSRGLAMQNSSNVRGVSNVVRAGENTFLTSSAATNIYFDESNDMDAVAHPGMMFNSVSGSNVAFLGTGSPGASGTWQIGDREVNSNPTAGGFLGNIVTTAGGPATWKTYGAITP